MNLSHHRLAHRRFAVHWLISLSACVLTALATTALNAESIPIDGGIWVEGESASASTMKRHGWYTDVDRGQLSGGDFASHFGGRPGSAIYDVQVPERGDYRLWVRGNPVQTKLRVRIDAGPWRDLPTSGDLIDRVNIAGDGKFDLRFLAWIDAGTVRLNGKHRIEFQAASDNQNHGSIDCFVLTRKPFRPDGALKPSEIEAAVAARVARHPGWVAFRPAPDPFASAELDLRGLNEAVAGENGFIQVRDGEFVRGDTGEPIRFWGVNGPASQDRDGLIAEAQMLAKRGVNLVRVHGAVFDNDGNVLPKKVQHIHDVVAAMKTAGIYSHLSIYFPLWMQPPADSDWLVGYDGTQNPFAVLMFNPKFQQRYRDWWRAILLTPDDATGRRLVDEPALAGIEMQNEDSFLFWTFDPKNLPDPQLRILERIFADWLIKRHGSLTAALSAWNGMTTPRDAPEDGRMGFRALWAIANERGPRDRDTAEFLTTLQRDFYSETEQFVRDIGFRGVTTASNWMTADNRVFGPLEKYSYGPGDLIDQHGYFGCQNAGKESAWSIRDGHTYIDRSATRLEGEGGPGSILTGHPIMTPKYDNQPSMLSETAWNRPNRYRGEAPLFLSTFASVQDCNSLVHFAQDGATWSVKPNFFMQPWTLMAPTQMGQFPAAALIYRQRMIDAGEPVANVDLNIDDLFALRGSPLAPGSSLDELRAADVPTASGSTQPSDAPEPAGDAVIDPLIYFTGPTQVRFTDGPSQSRVADLTKLIDRERRVITSRTGQVRLDYGVGVLTVRAPAAEVVSGHLRDAGEVRLDQMTVRSDLELGHIALVALDGKPLADSAEMLLQVMSEEKPTGFATTPLADGKIRIDSIGADPWLFKQITGTVELDRIESEPIRVVPLDPNGYEREAKSVEVDGGRIKLLPDVIYYRITR